MRVKSFIDADPEYTETTLVFIEVRGRITKDFHRWALDNDVFHERAGGTAGIGRTSSYYTPENAEKVLAWLTEQGATKTDEVPSWSVDDDA